MVMGLLLAPMIEILIFGDSELTSVGYDVVKAAETRGVVLVKSDVDICMVEEISTRRNQI
jgi:hypothetical protein